MIYNKKFLYKNKNADFSALEALSFGALPWAPDTRNFS